MQCADNAHIISGSSLHVNCTTSGWADDTPDCQCDDGYRLKTVGTRKFCEGRHSYSCIMLLKFVFLLYAICAAIPSCPAKIVGLVHYPTTLAQITGSATVTAKCADNAHKISSNLNVRCASDGTWSGTPPECECDIGYRRVNDNTGAKCEGL